MLQIPPEIATKYGKSAEEAQSLYNFTRQEIDGIILELQNKYWPQPVRTPKNRTITHNFYT